VTVVFEAEALQFNLKGHKVRILQNEQGEPWFVAKDVADVLGYRHTPHMTRNIDEEDAAVHNVSSRSDNGILHNREVTVINEFGLYDAIRRARSSVALDLKRWVTSKVIPTFRKKGAYLSEKTVKDVQVFSNFNGKDLRVVTDEQGEPWFVAKDVSDVLGYLHSSNMTRHLTKDVSAIRMVDGSRRGNPVTLIINESGLYTAIRRACSPVAEEFKQWVTSEILPSFHIQGAYPAEKPVKPVEPVKDEKPVKSVKEAELVEPVKEAKDVQVFDGFNGEDFRVVTDEQGEPWFVAIDVCRNAGIANSRNVIASLDDDEKDGVQIMDAIGRTQETTVVSEAGLYSLILRSRKPEAKEFKRWITHEVIPSIRKHGGNIRARRKWSMLS